jgi:hypothetical protein
MKILIIGSLCLLLANDTFSQENPEKKFTFSILTGIGIPLGDQGYFLVGIGGQGEYRLSERFSLYFPLQYQHIVGYGMEVGTLGLMAGPRYYVSPNFFAGIGAGYAFYLTKNFGYDGGFIYHPHVGLNLRKTQWTIGYYSGLVGYYEPFLDLKVAFKIGGRN